jgi:hypothetical protein
METKLNALQADAIAMKAAGLHAGAKA